MMRRLPRTPKRMLAIPGSGRLDEPTMAMILALTSEVTILRARLDACERLLVEAEIFSATAIDSFSPNEMAQAERERLRTRTLTKVLRPLTELAQQDLAGIQGASV